MHVRPARLGLLHTHLGIGEDGLGIGVDDTRRAVSMTLARMGIPILALGDGWSDRG